MPADDTLDPVYRHSRREALVILALWMLSFAWTVTYSYVNGYATAESPRELEMTLGIPSWVWWGIAVPWIVSGIVSILMCLFFIQDDGLGHAADEVPH